MLNRLVPALPADGHNLSGKDGQTTWTLAGPRSHSLKQEADGTYRLVKSGRNVPPRSHSLKQEANGTSRLEYRAGPVCE